MTGPMRENRLAVTDGLGLAYTDWGREESDHVVLCLHGLTRNGRDFDILAAALSADARVVCLDVVGRGASDWLADPAGYAYPLYLAHVARLLDHLGVTSVDVVGTSMGGLLGMMLAAAGRSPVRRLVMNDIGPFVPKTAIARIASYVGAEPRFADLAEAEAYLREVYADFGPMTAAQWRRFTETSVRADDAGRLRLAYDPAIGEAFRAAPPDDVDLWEVWERVTAPTLVLRGARSDLLLPETAAEMARRGARARIVEIANVGHCPALMDAEQIGLVRDWLGGEKGG